MAEEAENTQIVGDDAGAAEIAAPEVAAEAPVAAEAADPPEILDLAREMGWSEQDKWRGDPSKWKDARTFIRSTVDVNRSLSKDVRELKDQTSRIARTSAQIAEREIQRVRDEMEANFDAYVAAGDTQNARWARQELNRIDAQAQPSELAGPVQDFISRNGDWWNKNDEATAYVVSVAERVARRGGDAAEQAAEAERSVKARFPELFEPPATRQAAKAQPSVNSPGSRAAPAPKAKTAANLPPDARKAGEDFVRRGRMGSLEEYAKLYYEEQE